MAMTVDELIQALDENGISHQVPDEFDDRVVIGVATEGYIDQDGNQGIPIQLCLAEAGSVAYFFVALPLFEHVLSPVSPLMSLPNRERLLEFTNHVNNQVKFSGFSVDDSDDVVFLYALPIEEEGQKLGVATIARICEATADAVDMLYRLLAEADSNE
ncbi:MULTISPECIES: YbjN domain-containing protein [Pseudidiomarina]|nr:MULTISPECIES: YbjN domain-containing protein [Pseudidiomarina]CUA85848.1 Putative bacterial sensory transduction regulator [Pseudidiomarina woesei]